MNKIKLLLASLLIVLTQLSYPLVPKAHAATSPILTDSASYSILGHTEVTNTDSPTTTTGDVGVSTGTSITNFPPGIAGGDNSTHLHSNDASAIAAQADNLIAFGALDQDCTTTYPTGTKDLVGLTLSPGVYCADAFALSGTLNLTGSGVWIFKSSATLITSNTANIVGGDPCNVWWRVASSATLGTNTSLIGNILAYASIALETGADLYGRAMVQTGAVTMDNNTVSGPICVAAATPTPTPSSSTSSTSTSEEDVCIAPSDTIVTPIIIEVKRVSSTSVYLSWGPYSGTDTFNVRYGLENGNWLYNTDVTGFNTTINALPSNQPIWFQVAARNNCAIGTYGEPKQITTGSVLGASTTTLAATGFTDQLIRIGMSMSIALSILFLGKSLLRGNEKS